MKNLFTLAMLFSVFMTFAQDSIPEAEEAPKKKFSLSGSGDVYYRTNIGAPNGGENHQSPNTSFANQNGFAIGMANVILAYEGKKVGAVADLVFGPRGTDAVFGSLQWDIDGDGAPDLGNSSQVVNQLYVYWNVSDKVTLTLGNFNTFLGYEVISPTGNFNYSTSYMFSYGPFSHAGLKMDWAINDDWSFMAAVMNDNDYTSYNPTNNFTLGAQVGYKGTYLNFLYGPQFQVDLTTGFDITDSFYLGLNSTYYADNNSDASFYGVAIYPQLQTSESFVLGFRAEYFGEGDGGVGAIGGYDDDGNATAFEFTLTGNYAIGDLMIIPEFRIDTTSEDTFYNDDLEPTGSLASFLVAAVYKF
ncbi:porin [Lutimonas sp.]|uniref:porin n=1 Tax=Lutimonas sp. TaxID=1872403 RepID=UPI003D9B67FD